MSHRLIVTFPTRAQDEIPASALCTASVNERRSAPHSWRVLINGHRAQTKRLRNLIPIRIVKERNTRGRARFALVSIFISLMAGFIGGFLTFNFGYAWFRNGVVVFDELSRTQPELRGILSIVRIVVLGGSAAGVLGGVAVWHWFVGVAARYGLRQGGWLAHGFWFRGAAYLLWAAMGFAVSSLVLIPSGAFIIGGGSLVDRVSPSFAHPWGRSSNTPILTGILGVLTCVPLTLIACVALLHRWIGMSKEELGSLLGVQL